MISLFDTCLGENFLSLSPTPLSFSLSRSVGSAQWIIYDGPPSDDPAGPLRRLVSGALGSSSLATRGMKVAVPSRYGDGSRECISQYPLGGSLTIISAVRVRQQPLTHWSMPTHAASLSPFLVPLSHPCATPLLPPFLPYPGTLSRSLPRPRSLGLPLASSPFLSPSHMPPLVSSFSRAHAALYRFISHRTRRLPLATFSLFLYGTLVLLHALFPLDPFAVWLAYAGHRWGAETWIDLSNPDLIGFLRACTFFFPSRARNSRDSPPPPPCNISMHPDWLTEQKLAWN